jgi:predicted Zn-ribbon and HTH transcriptional regulator
MKRDLIQCAWVEICDGKIERTIEIKDSQVLMSFAKCKKCGNQTYQ